MVVRRKREFFISGQKFLAFGGICGGERGFPGRSSEEEHPRHTCMGARGRDHRIQERSSGPSPSTGSLRPLGWCLAGDGALGPRIPCLTSQSPVSLTSKSARTSREHPDLRNKAESQQTESSLYVSPGTACAWAAFMFVLAAHPLRVLNTIIALFYMASQTLPQNNTSPF